MCIRDRHFANRGAAAGPFCFVYGSTAVLLAVGFTDLRSDPVYLFFACTLASTVMEWLTAKLLERLHRRKWWDYSGKRFKMCIRDRQDPRPAVQECRQDQCERRACSGQDRNQEGGQVICCF